MNILAFDTSTQWMTIAVKIGDQLFSCQQQAGAKASRLILPKIQALLTEANISLKKLDGVAFGAGPGAFTGVRVACGVAQGLAFGANLPVVAINTLTAIAQASAQDKVVICQDARMGEIYHAALERKGGVWVEHQPASVCKPEDAPVLNGNDWVGVGSGWNVYETILNAQYSKNLINKVEDVMPTAQAIVQLAVPLFIAGEAAPASKAKPIYIRNRVALTESERAVGQML